MPIGVRYISFDFEHISNHSIDSLARVEIQGAVCMHQKTFSNFKNTLFAIKTSGCLKNVVEHTDRMPYGCLMSVVTSFQNLD